MRSTTCTISACCRTGISTTRTSGKNLRGDHRVQVRVEQDHGHRGQGQLAAVVQVQQVAPVAVLGLGVALQHDPLHGPLGVLRARPRAGSRTGRPWRIRPAARMPRPLLRLVVHARRDARPAPAAPLDGGHELAFLGRDHGARVAAVLERAAHPVGEDLGVLLAVVGFLAGLHLREGFGGPLLFRGVSCPLAALRA